MVTSKDAFKRALLGSMVFTPWLVSAVPSYACGGLLPKPVEWKPKPGETKMFHVNDRVVRVTVPLNYNTSNPAPMIVAFHDRDQPKEHLEFEAAFYENKINPDAIMVYPTAEEDRWLGDSLPLPEKEAKEYETKAKKAKKSKKGKEEEVLKPGQLDIQFTSDLLNDLENLVCIDTSRVYATGMGTGGGMMHMLACNKELSTKFAAFAAVGAAFGRDKKGIWGTCEPGRPSIPIAEIHGMDNRIFPYYLKEGENGKVRTIPPHWIEDWAERNECGEPTRDPKVSADDEATFVTKLDNGWMTETVGSGGSAIRIARKCFGKASEGSKEDTKEETTEASTQDQDQDQEEGVEEKDPRGMPTGPIPDAETTVLHYQIKSYGHGWPRQQLVRQKEVAFKNKMIKPSGDLFFDTTKVILDFFTAHRLPEEFARRAEVTPEDIVPKSTEKSKIKMENAAEIKAETPMEEKLRKFQEAQERLQSVGEEGEVVEETQTTDEKDEL